MENTVWSKAAQFLKMLRCEDTGRESYLELPEYKDALEEKRDRRENAEHAFRQIEPGDRKEIQEYIDALEACAEEENQQAYLQGIVDSIMLMSGMGILKETADVKELMEQLK